MERWVSPEDLFFGPVSSVPSVEDLSLCYFFLLIISSRFAIARNFCYIFVANS